MPIITISRGSMSGGQALAECLSSTLGLPCANREEVVAEAAKTLGVSTELLAQKLDTAPGLWDRLTLERHRFVVATQAALAERCAAGALIYHGQAGHMLLRGVPGVLRVRLIAPLEMRIAALVERHGMGRRAAEAYIEQVDEERTRWARFIYDVDPGDPRLYDLVLSLERLTVEDACAVVSATARRPEFETTPRVLAALADFVVACRVRLALATAPATRALQLDARADRGVVTVSGRVPEPAMLTHVSNRLGQEIESIAAGVAGVVGVRLDLESFDQYH